MHLDELAVRVQRARVDAAVRKGDAAPVVGELVREARPRGGDRRLVERLRLHLPARVGPHRPCRTVPVRPCARPLSTCRRRRRRRRRRYYYCYRRRRRHLRPPPRRRRDRAVRCEPSVHSSRWRRSLASLPLGGLVSRLLPPFWMEVIQPVADGGAAASCRIDGAPFFGRLPLSGGGGFP